MNRIAGNIVIIDSAMGNNLVLTSANQAILIDNLMANAISFIATDTTGNITLTGSNTAQDLVYVLDFLSGGGGSTTAPNPIHFSAPQRIGNLKVPRLTAGTALIYLA